MHTEQFTVNPSMME